MSVVDWENTGLGKMALRCKHIVEHYGGKVDANKQGIELIAYFGYALGVEVGFETKPLGFVNFKLEVQ